MVETALRFDPASVRAIREARLIALQPEWDRALALGQEGQLDAQRDVLLGLVERFPREPELLISLSANAVVRDEYTEAAAYARRVAESAGDDPEALFRAAWFIRWADAGSSRKYLEQVKAMLATSRSSDSFVFVADLAHLEGLLAIAEDHEELSIPFLERAFELDAAGVGIAADLALAYNRSGQVEQALNLLARGLEHRPEDERILDTQALIRAEQP